MSRKSLINFGDTNNIFVLDTNIFSDIFEASPDYYNFIIQCLDKVRSRVFLTDTIQHELLPIRNKPYSPTVFNDEKQKVLDLIVQHNQKDLVNIEKLKKYEDNLQEISIFKEAIGIIKEKNDQLTSLLNDLKLTKLIEPSLSISDVNYVRNFILEIIDSGRISDSLDRVTTEKISYEVDKRHSKGSVFPDKNKKGISKYNDYFIFEEMKELSRSKSKDIYFVTADNKGNFQDKEAIEKFKQDTSGHTVEIISGNSFYKSISEYFGISQENITELFIREDKFEFEAELRNSNEIEKLIEDYLYNDIEGEDEELESYNIDLYDTEVVSFTEKSANYIIEISLEAEKIYYDYWGRDDDTKDIITSPPNYKSYDGVIKVIVSRKFKVESKKLITSDIQLDILDISNINKEIVTWGELEDKDSFY